MLTHLDKRWRCASYLYWILHNPPRHPEDYKLPPAEDHHLLPSSPGPKALTLKHYEAYKHLTSPGIFRGISSSLLRPLEAHNTSYWVSTSGDPHIPPPAILRPAMYASLPLHPKGQYLILQLSMSHLPWGLITNLFVLRPNISLLLSWDLFPLIF